MACPSRAEPGAAGTRGLTLVELLVALLILSLVMTLVAQAVSQTAQVARVAQDSSRELHSSWNKGWAVRELLSHLSAPPEGGERPFEGDGESLRGYSLRPLSGAEQGVKPFSLRLRAEDGSSGSASRGAMVLLDEHWESRGLSSPAVVAHFEQPVEFAFQDAQGGLHAAWPTPAYDPRDVQAAALPSAVLVRTREGGRPLLWFAYSGNLRRQNVRGKMFWEQ